MVAEAAAEVVPMAGRGAEAMSGGEDEETRARRRGQGLGGGGEERKR